MVDKLSPAKATDMKALIDKWNAGHQLTPSTPGVQSAPSAASVSSPQPKRTLCRPTFDEEQRPTNFKSVWEPSQVPSTTFEADVVSTANS